MKFGSFASINVKLILVIIAVLIALSTIFYTQVLIKQIQERERRSAEIFVEIYHSLNSNEGQSKDLTLHLELIKKIDLPLVVTNSFSDSVLFTKNIIVDSSLTAGEMKKAVDAQINQLISYSPSIDFTLEGKVLQKVFYGESKLIQQLKYYPFLQILTAALFIILSYVSFNYIKKSEQSNIWVGMSKETAHQIGTPLSSLLGWNEYLKLSYSNPDKVLDISDEIDSDLTRLKKIADRFSKIGSKPVLSKTNVYDSILQVLNYFQRRLPQTGKEVSLSVTGDKSLNANLNLELFEWVVENLVKNSLDAIGAEKGMICFYIYFNENIIIEVSDNGKGIEKKNKKNVFKPGFSTKKRGWGLGLSLTKRIIKDYHHGQIYIKSSTLNKGTTFIIILKTIES